MIGQVMKMNDVLCYVNLINSQLFPNLIKIYYFILIFLLINNLAF